MKKKVDWVVTIIGIVVVTTTVIVLILHWLLQDSDIVNYILLWFVFLLGVLTILVGIGAIKDNNV
jgi:hypothetical protein